MAVVSTARKTVQIVIIFVILSCFITGVVSSADTLSRSNGKPVPLVKPGLSGTSFNLTTTDFREESGDTSVRLSDDGTAGTTGIADRTVNPAGTFDPINISYLKELAQNQERKVSSSSGQSHGGWFANDISSLVNVHNDPDSVISYRFRYYNPDNGQVLNNTGFMIGFQGLTNLDVLTGLEPTPLCEDSVCDPEQGDYQYYMLPFIEANSNTLFIRLFTFNNDRGTFRQKDVKVELSEFTNGANLNSDVRMNWFGYGYGRLEGSEMSPGVWALQLDLRELWPGNLTSMP